MNVMTDEHPKIRVVVVILPDHNDGDACNPFFMALLGITSHAYRSVCIVIHKTRRLSASFHFLCEASSLRSEPWCTSSWLREEAFPNAWYPEFVAQILIIDATFFASSHFLHRPYITRPSSCNELYCRFSFVV
jgi:hypothetical protein